MRKLLMILAVLLLSFGIFSCTGKNEIDLIFEENGGSEVEDITISTNSTSIELPEPTKDGFIFDGWFLDEDLSEPFTIAALLTQTGELKLYAKWTSQIVQYTITFESNGGSVVSAITQAPGTDVTEPTAPTKTDFTFVGWYSDIGLTTAYTFTTMPEENITLYAKWNPVILNQTITFEVNGGSAVAAITQAVGSAVTAPTPPTKTGYTFVGWYSDSGLTTAYSFTTMPSAAITLYAKWAVNSYTITFNENGGTAVVDITEDYNEVVTAPPAPTKTGYTFAGWYSDSGLTNAYTFVTMPAQNTTLYAKWIANNYTISFEENGGTIVSDITQVYMTAVTAPTPPTKDGYVFVGWFSEVGLVTPYTFTTIPAENITLYAKWDYQNYTITFVDAPNLEPMNVKAYTTITLPTALKEGYNHIGWFEDEFFLQAFELEIMPEENITLYAKWSLANYVVTYETNGGTAIEPSQAFFASEIPVPSDPSKTGHTFAGWFLDIDLTELLTDQPMPAHAITLYAKWVAVDSTWTLHDILLYQPAHVKVSGTIIYKFPDPMNPGFYLTDGTATMFVLSGIQHNVGDMLSFEADFGFFEYNPQLTNMTNKVLITEGTPIVATYTAKTIAEIVEEDPDNAFAMSQTILIQGVIQSGGTSPFGLVEVGSGNRIDINIKSITPGSNPFEGHVGELITIRAIVYGYNEMSEMWHILYDPSVTVQYTEQTVAEKIEAILDFGEMMLDGQVFYSTQTLMLPETEEVYTAALSFVTSGENAAYYNPITGIFQPTSIDRQITLRMTVTIGEESAYRDVTLILRPTEILTISEFLELEDESYGIVEGIVVFMIDIGDMKLTILADETGAILPIEAEVTIEVGKHVTVQGYHYQMMDLVIMTGIEDPLVSTIATGVANPLTPLVVNADQFMELDPYESIYWARYFEVFGELKWNDLNHYFELVTDEVILPVMVFDMDDMETLNSLTGLDVAIRGYALPNFDDEPYLMFIFSGQSEDIIIDYTDQELVDHIATILKEYLESNTYLPGTALDLPETHDIFDMIVTYEVDVIDATKVVEGMIVNPNIEVETTITLHATLNMNEASSNVDIILNVVPLELLTIAEILALDDEQLHFVKVVIMFISPLEIMIVADESGVSLTNSPQGDYSVGDLVILQATKMEASGMTLLANDPTKLVHFVIAHDQDIPIDPAFYTVNELHNIGSVDPDITLKYVTVMGQLIGEQPSSLILTDGEHQVYIFSPLGLVPSTDFTPFMNKAVKMTGFWMNQGPLVENQVIIFSDRPGDVVLFDGQELVDYLADELTDEFDQKIVRPGSTHLLPYTYPPFEFDVVYEVTTDPSDIYNVMTGFVSADITEETIVTLSATISSGEYTAIAEFSVIVQPIETDTIAEFLAGDDGESFMVRGIVVTLPFNDGPMIIADDTGYMFILKPFDVALGDDVVIEGMVDDSMGLNMMENVESTQLIEIISINEENPLTPTPYSITDINSLDMEVYFNWGKYVETTGYYTMIEDSYFPLLQIEITPSEFVPIIPLYLFTDELFMDPSVFYELQGLRVNIKGYLMPNIGEEDPEAPDRLLVIASEDDIELDYDTEDEMIDALILLAQTSLESDYFRPGDTLDLPDYYAPFDAELSWEFTSDITDIFDEATMTFLDVIVTTEVSLSLTMTIGETTDGTGLTLTVAPYEPITIEDFFNLDDNEFAKLNLVVAVEISGYHYILQEPGSQYYLVAYWNEGLTVGDQITIFGRKQTYSGLAVITDYDEEAYYLVTDTEVTVPLFVTQSTLQEVARRDITKSYPMYYCEVTGRLIYDDFGEYYLTDGINYIALRTADYGTTLELDSYLDQDIKVLMFNHETVWSTQGDVWSAYIIGTEASITEYTYTDEQILGLLDDYIQQYLMIEFKDGLTYQLPETHPIYGGTYGYEVGATYESDATINNYIITFVDSLTDYSIAIDIDMEYNEQMLEKQIPINVTVYDAPELMFTPGEGVLPTVSGTLPPNTFAGLYVHQIDRNYDFMFDTYNTEAWLMFPEPFYAGASYYYLQFYNEVTTTWENYENFEGPIQFTYNNAVIEINQNVRVRLLSDVGSVSNEVLLEYTNINTRFDSWGYDQSVNFFEVMMPFVGYQILLDNVTIYDDEDQLMETGYTIQWYRINPITFEETLIDGATNELYTTTLADVGYYLLIEIEGDEESVGGILRILIEDRTKIDNLGVIYNVTNAGFDLACEYLLDLLTLQEFMYINSNFDSVEILGITETETEGVYHIEADLNPKITYFVNLENDVMILTSLGEYHTMKSISFTLEN